MIFLDPLIVIADQIVVAVTTTLFVMFLFFFSFKKDKYHCMFKLSQYLCLSSSTACVFLEQMPKRRKLY